ncbi:DNA phosphorothioation system restriction enzyme [Salinibacter sp.]|uniref:DNA phosphorothioation system restriction enzyme n=1 Tax=Salinibacter sp. TaxID=2065818 RepID=UPI0021E965CB|nr:DNA phosphorothioation system restriction enzyme [Salinibacter sp.]
MRIVSSPVLSLSDYKSIFHAHKYQYQISNKIKFNNYDLSSLDTKDSLYEYISYLISTGSIDIKFAILEDKNRRGIYHEKIGIFKDEESSVVFSGSANETFSGVVRNFEQVDVFRSWKKNERLRADRKKRSFDRLWENETRNLEVISFPEANRRNILEIRPEDKGRTKLANIKSSNSLLPHETEPGSLGEILKIPSDIDLYSHQRVGVREWLTHSGRGILEMATGSGKTIAALSAATKLYEITGPPLLLVIVCPYLHLVDQWREEAEEFGLNPLICAYGREEWYEQLQVKIFNLKSENTRILSIISTNKTFLSKPFQRSIGRVRERFLFVADEVHNLGAESLRECLPDNAQYRLGLSATPERWFDPKGTEALQEYFGPSLVEYTLEEALSDEVLCPYQYIPHVVELSDVELSEYSSLSKQIARTYASEKDSFDQPSQKLKALLIKRARLIATAENKLDVLRQLMRDRRNSKHVLVYCGDGRVEEAGSEQEIRQIKAVTQLLGNELQMRVATYTAETSTERRRQLRKDFAEGNIQCLVAIRCLDEGVDIPETETAFVLASTSNPRQFIQRRGRLLRRASGKNMATIHDFVVAPPEEHRNPDSDHFTATRKLFAKELRRVFEFADLAENGPEARGKLLDIRDELNLLDIDTSV